MKDTLLGVYLHVYFSKVIHTKRPIVYIDCFAGAGKFKKGGEDGSPRIALKERKIALEASAYAFPNATIDMYFIEPIYSEALSENIQDFPIDDGHGTINVINGKYEDSVLRILANYRDANIFLYVDPFGIKNLGNRIFIDVCKRFNERVELLLNLNSFGFIRDACRVVGTSYNGVEADLEERDCDVPSGLTNDRTLLTAIAGGDYWEKIIDQYLTFKTLASSLDAENLFSTAYKHMLSKVGGGPFTYVLDLPIRIKKGSYPKYRLVHATNHHDGCIAMADIMIHRADELYCDVQSDGQLSLFEFDVNQNMKPHESVLREGLLKVLRNKADSFLDKLRRFGFTIANPSFFSKVKVRLNSLLAMFFCENGVVCSTKDLIGILKSMETDGIIEVFRNPPLTEGGKVSTFWSDDKGRQVLIKLKGALK